MWEVKSIINGNETIMKTAEESTAREIYKKTRNNLWELKLNKNISSELKLVKNHLFIKKEICSEKF